MTYIEVLKDALVGTGHEDVPLHHVEAFMRAQHTILGELRPAAFRKAARAAAAAVASISPEEAEDIAHAYGLSA